ncbi:hypothetical protein [Streptomyces sp. NPDC003697]
MRVDHVGARLREGRTWHALPSGPGIAGAHRPAFLPERQVPWGSGRPPLPHSDGLPSRWAPPSEPGPPTADPAAVAAATVRDAGSSARPLRDDTAVAVLTTTPPDHT